MSYKSFKNVGSVYDITRFLKYQTSNGRGYPVTFNNMEILIKGSETTHEAFSGA